MLPLAERHASRAKRIVANGSEIGAVTAGSLGTVATLFTDFITALHGLTEDEREQFKEQVAIIESEVTGFDSLAEAPDGTRRTMAGIGVVNPMVVPASIELPEAGNGGGTDVKHVDGWGANASPAATVKTSDTNLGGEALQDQDAGSDLKAAKKAAETPAPVPAAGTAPAPAPAPAKKS